MPIPDSSADPTAFLSEQLEMAQIKMALVRRHLAGGDMDRAVAAFRETHAHMNAATDTFRDIVAPAATVG